MLDPQLTHLWCITQAYGGRIYSYAKQGFWERSGKCLKWLVLLFLLQKKTIWLLRAPCQVNAEITVAESGNVHILVPNYVFWAVQADWEGLLRARFSDDLMHKQDECPSSNRNVHHVQHGLISTRLRHSRCSYCSFYSALTCLEHWPCFTNLAVWQMCWMLIKG